MNRAMVGHFGALAVLVLFLSMPSGAVGGRSGEAGRSQKHRFRRHRLDARQCRPGPHDDRAGPGAFLRRARPQEKCPVHDDALLHADGAGQRLWAIVGYSLAFDVGTPVHRRIPFRLSARRRRRPLRIRADHPAHHLDGVPDDVRRHHPGADLRRLRRANEIQRMLIFSTAVAAGRLLPDGPHGLGQRRAVQRGVGMARAQSPRWILPAGRSCISVPAFRALVCASGAGQAPRISARSPMPPHSVVLSVIGAAMLWVGWFGFNAGSALQAGIAGQHGVRQHPLRRRGRRHWRGRSSNGSRAGKPTVLGAISGAVAGLGRDHARLRGYTRRCTPWSSARRRDSSASSPRRPSSISSATTTPSTPSAFTASAERSGRFSPASSRSRAVNTPRRVSDTATPARTCRGSCNPRLVAPAYCRGDLVVHRRVGSLVMLLMVKATFGLRVT